MQCVEIRDAIDAEYDGLTIEDELLVPVLQRGLDDPWIPFRPVVTAARQQLGETGFAYRQRRVRLSHTSFQS